MHLLRCCLLVGPMWLFWIVAIILYPYFESNSINEIPWIVLVSAVVFFPFPVFGLWFYAGIDAGKADQSSPMPLENLITSFFATLVLILLVSIPASIWPMLSLSSLQVFRLYWPLGGFAWALYTISLLIFKIFHLKENLERMQRLHANLEKVVRETELEYLRSQLNPHFLFNALNSISNLTLTQPTKAHSMILELSDYLRSGLLRPAKGLVSLEKELEACKLYLNIEKMRFGQRLCTDWQVSDDALQRLIPQTLLQPIYENAIKYGVSENPNPTTLTTLTFIDNDLLTITISHPLPPFIPEKKGKGMGLKNIRQRLEILYQRTDLIEIIKDDSTFTVTLKIPAQPAQLT